MSDLVGALPRASAEASRVEGLTRALTQDLARVEGRLVGIEAATSSHVLVLERLDLLKRNMETCAETLTEAANWSALVREVLASFAAQVGFKAPPFLVRVLEPMHHLSVEGRRWGRWRGSLRQCSGASVCSATSPAAPSAARPCANSPTNSKRFSPD